MSSSAKMGSRTPTRHYSSAIRPGGPEHEPWSAAALPSLASYPRARRPETLPPPAAPATSRTASTSTSRLLGADAAAVAPPSRGRWPRPGLNSSGHQDVLTETAWQRRERGGRRTEASARASQLSQILEEIRLRANDLDGLGGHSKLVVLQKIAEIHAVNQINGRRSVANSLTLCVLRESSRGQEQAFVRASNHGSSEIANLARSDRTGVPLALKTDMEREKVDAQDARAVNASISRPTSHFDLYESCLSQQALA